MGQGGHGGHAQQFNPQQQMASQMQMPPMGAFAGPPFAPGPGPLMGQPMGHIQMHQQMQQQGGGMPQVQYLLEDLEPCWVCHFTTPSPDGTLVIKPGVDMQLHARVSAVG